MLTVNQLVGFGVGSEPPVEGSFIDKYYVAGPVTNWSSTSVNLGATDPDRYIAVVLLESMQAAVVGTTALTINGVSATRVANNADTTTSYRCSVWVAKVPTGTTGITISGTRANFGNQTVAAVYRMVKLQSATPVSADGTQSTVSTTTISVSIDKRDGGFVVAGAKDWTNGPMTWTGVDTEDYDYQPAGNTYFSGAHETVVGGGLTTVQVELTTAYTSFAMVAACFR